MLTSVRRTSQQTSGNREFIDNTKNSKRQGNLLTGGLRSVDRDVLTARHAGLNGSLRHSSRHGLHDPAIENAGDDVIGTQFVFGNHVGNRVRRSKFHFRHNLLSTNIQ